MTYYNGKNKDKFQIVIQTDSGGFCSFVLSCAGYYGRGGVNMAHSLHLFYLMRLRHVKDGKTAKENAIPLSKRVTAERIAENTRVASRT